MTFAISIRRAQTNIKLLIQNFMLLSIIKSTSIKSEDIIARCKLNVEAQLWQIQAQIWPLAALTLHCTLFLNTFRWDRI